MGCKGDRDDGKKGEQGWEPDLWTDPRVTRFSSAQDGTRTSQPCV